MDVEKFEKIYGHWLKYVPEGEYKFIMENPHPHWMNIMDKTIKNVIKVIETQLKNLNQDIKS